MMDNLLFKYFCDLCKIYTSIKYCVIFVYILRFVSSFANVTMIIESHNSVNEISKCFV